MQKALQAARIKIHQITCGEAVKVQPELIFRQPQKSSFCPFSIFYFHLAKLKLEF
jgi:hypothetical protein